MDAVVGALMFTGFDPEGVAFISPAQRAGATARLPNALDPEGGALLPPPGGRVAPLQGAFASPLALTQGCATLALGCRIAALQAAGIILISPSPTVFFCLLQFLATPIILVCATSICRFVSNMRK
jgi:hypothetical protein